MFLEIFFSAHFGAQLALIFWTGSLPTSSKSTKIVDFVHGVRNGLKPDQNFDVASSPLWTSSFSSQKLYMSLKFIADI